MDMTKKTLLVAAVVFIAIVLLFTCWQVLLVLAFIGLAWLLVDLGPEKSLAWLKEAFVDVFTYGKTKVKEAAKNDVQEELEIHDAVIKPLENGTYELSVFTERGKLTLEPRKFNVIPEVLNKGNKVIYREVTTWEDARIKKRITISAVGKDGEERVFRIVTD